MAEELALAQMGWGGFYAGGYRVGALYGYGPAFTKINVMRKDLLDFFRVRGVRWRKEGEVEGRRRAGWTLEGRFEDTFVW